MADVQTNVDINIGLDAQIPLSEQLTEVLTNFLVLYQDPKFIGCVVIAFMAAQLTHVIMRGYFQATRDLTKALFCWGTHIIVGGITAHFFLSHMDDVAFFRLFTGTNSLVLYYVLIWLSTKWFRWPSVAQWLTLRTTKTRIVNAKVIIEFGDTVAFLQPRRKRK